MKSTIHEHQKSNYSIVSKNSILLLGLVVLSFTSAHATTAFETQVLDQQESATVIVENIRQQNQVVLAEGTLENTVDNEANTAVFSPNSVIKSYVKTTEEVMAEDKLITEGKEITPLYLSLGYEVEDRIAEDNQIVEGNISNEVFPLDFNKINRAAKTNNDALINRDIKL